MASNAADAVRMKFLFILCPFMYTVFKVCAKLFIIVNTRKQGFTPKQNYIFLKLPPPEVSILE
jgi:hypothetical protein